MTLILNVVFLLPCLSENPNVLEQYAPLLLSLSLSPSTSPAFWLSKKVPKDIRLLAVPFSWSVFGEGEDTSRFEYWSGERATTRLRLISWLVAWTARYSLRYSRLTAGEWNGKGLTRASWLPPCKQRSPRCGGRGLPMARTGPTPPCKVCREDGKRGCDACYFRAQLALAGSSAR